MPTRQHILIGAGILFVLITIRHAVVGRRTAWWGTKLHRGTAPGAFWLTIVLDACLSVAFLIYALLHGPH